MRNDYAKNKIVTMHASVPPAQEKLARNSCKFWRRSVSGLAAALAVTTLMSFATLARAQQMEGQAAIFALAAKEDTSTPGVRVFADRPKDFDPLAATNRELAQYGLPLRPDSSIDPTGYATWEGALRALKTRPTDVKPQKTFHREMVPNQLREGVQVLGGPVSESSYNWSGAASTNKNRSWSPKTSFNYVVSVWNVPNAQPPFGACANGITGPFYESSWNGIDGFGADSKGDVVQGGSTSYADCSGGRLYYGWVEWYPSYPELAIYCGASLCPVNPGDDFYVVTYGVAGTASQSVFVEDITNQWGGTYSMSWQSGPGLVGGSAEWVVERPSDANGNRLPLANTRYEFFGDSYAFDGVGAEFHPGSQSLSTYDFSMVADDGSTVIEFDTTGTNGFQGLTSLWFQDAGCAEFNGCTP